MSSFLSRVGSRSTLNKEYKCTIRLLDDSETLQCEFQKHHTGQFLLDYVCNHLQLVEKDYFGIRFMDGNKHRYWLDLNKPIKRQLRDELGDYNPDEHKDGYVSQYKILLRQTAKLEDKIAQLHKSLEGQVPAEVEMNFLKKAASLETYGFDPYSVKDSKNGQVFLSATYRGVLVYQSNRKLYHLPWESIEKMDYVGKEFVVYVKPDAEIDIKSGEFQQTLADLLLVSDGDRRKIIFYCPTGSFSKHLWKYALEQQGFFTCMHTEAVKPQTAHKRIPFLRGSTFRYSNRHVYSELKDFQPMRRSPPTYQRFHIERQPSRAEREPPWGPNKFATMPRSGMTPFHRDWESLGYQSNEAPEDLMHVDVENMSPETSGLSSPQSGEGGGGLSGNLGMPVATSYHSEIMAQAPDDSCIADGPADSTLNASLSMDEPKFSSSRIIPEENGPMLGSDIPKTGGIYSNAIPSVCVSNSFTGKSAAIPCGDGSQFGSKESNGVIKSSMNNGKANGYASSTSEKLPYNHSNTEQQDGSATRSDVTGHDERKNSGRSGLCTRALGLFLTFVLFSTILVSICILVMESKDARIREQLGRYPIVDTFRHQYYEPGKAQILSNYQKLQAMVAEKGWIKAPKKR